MRHRKKLLLAALTLVTGFAVFHFWPRDKAEVRRLIDELGSLLESERQRPWPAAGTSKVDTDAQFDVDVIVAKVDMTDAASGLFANPANLFTVVPLTSKQRITDVLRELCAAQAATIVDEPRLVVRPGKPASTAIRSQVPFPIKTPGPAPALIYRNVGVNVGVTAKGLSNGRVELELDCELSCIAEMIPTPQGINQPVVNSGKCVASVILGDRETLLIGNLKQKGAMPVSFKAPLLSDLPGIGPMFCCSWQRPIDEELIILATPRIVTPVAAK